MRDALSNTHAYINPECNTKPPPHCDSYTETHVDAATSSDAATTAKSQSLGSPIANS
jgi:hypothetical protein